jgi:ABC-type Zn uptake system ZnuABC Zn-binding protein ZnuA
MGGPPKRQATILTCGLTSLAYVYVEIVADELIIYDGVHQDIYDGEFTEFKHAMLDFQDEIYAQLQAVPSERRKLITLHNSLDHFARKFDLEVAGYAGEMPADPRQMPSRGWCPGKRPGYPGRLHRIWYDSAIMSQVAAAAGVPMCTLYSDIVDDALAYEQMMRSNADEIVRCLTA